MHACLPPCLPASLLLHPLAGRQAGRQAPSPLLTLKLPPSLPGIKPSIKGIAIILGWTFLAGLQMGISEENLPWEAHIHTATISRTPNSSQLWSWRRWVGADRQWLPTPPSLHFLLSGEAGDNFHLHTSHAESWFPYHYPSHACPCCLACARLRGFPGAWLHACLSGSLHFFHYSMPWRDRVAVVDMWQAAEAVGMGKAGMADRHGRQQWQRQRGSVTAWRVTPPPHTPHRPLSRLPARKGWLGPSHTHAHCLPP